MALADTTIFLCPHHGKGHLNPIIALARRLYALGISVTLVCPDKFTRSLFRTSEEEGFNFLPLEDEHDQGKEASPSYAVKKGEDSIGWPDFTPQLHKFRALLADLAARSQLPSAVIFDAVNTWAQDPASQFAVPTYALYTASTSNLVAAFYARSHTPQEAAQGMESGRPGNVPGIPPVPFEEMMWRLKLQDTSIDHPFVAVYTAWDEQLVNSHGVLLNSMPEIEGRAISVLRKGELKAAKPFADKLFTVGPLLPPSYLEGSDLESIKRSVNIPSKMEMECEGWLNAQPPRSVLFVSFGSWEKLYVKQVSELAAGLEASNVRFLWVFPAEEMEENSNQDYLQGAPPGFLERVRERSLILSGWAPQHLILAHPAVGAFLSHCGWNSSIECMLLAGVPIICWPFIGDQPLNSRHLARELKIGVEVEATMEEGVIGRHEVARAVKLAMEGDEAEAMRTRATKLKEAIKTGVTRSNDELSKFVNEIKSKVKGDIM